MSNEIKLLVKVNCGNANCKNFATMPADIRVFLGDGSIDVELDPTYPTSWKYVNDGRATFGWGAVYKAHVCPTCSAEVTEKEK